MATDYEEISDEDLRRQREGIQRSLRRIHVLVLSVLGVVIVLALVGLGQTWRVDRETDRAREATERAETLRGEQEEARATYLKQVRAWRENGEVSQRARAMEILETAAKIRPGADLRKEALAWMPFSALEPEGFVRLPVKVPSIGFDAAVERVALSWNRSTVNVFSLSQGRELFTLPGTDGSVGWLRFSTDGRWLVGRHHSKAINGILWNIETRQVARRFPAAQGVFTDGGYDFSPDSRRLAVAAPQNRVQFFELPSHRELDPLEVSFPVRSLKFCPDGEHLALAANHVVEVWSVTQRALVQRLDAKFAIDWVAWHPRGRWVAVAGAHSDVLLWNWNTQRVRRIPTGETRVLEVHFHPDGNRMATWSAKDVVAEWDLATGARLAEHEQRRADHYSNDGRRLSMVKPGENCGAWKLPSAFEYRGCFAVDPPFFGLAWTENDQLLVANDDSIHLWNPREGSATRLAAFRMAHALRLVPNQGYCLAAGAEGVARWRVSAKPDGAMALGSPEHFRADWRDGIDALFTSEGARLALKGGGLTRLFSIGEGLTPGATLFEGEKFGRLAFSPDDQKIAGVSPSGMAIWDARTGARQHSETGPVRAVAFSPGHRWLAMARDDKLVLRDARTLSDVWETPVARSSIPATAIAFTADEQWLAVSTVQGVQLYRSEGLELLGELIPPSPVKWAYSLAFNKSGTQLATLNKGESLQHWDLALIREQLSRMRLDFDQPMLAPPDPSPAVELAASGSSARSLVLVALASVVLAIVFSALASRRSQKLVESYFRVDALVMRRNEQLASAQSELAQSQKMRALGTLAAGIAHDFNNLLSVIRMANKLTGEETPGNADVQENVQLVEKTVAQGKGVVRSMLGYSRKPGERGRFSVTAVVEETIKMLHTQFLGGITLEVSLDSSTPEVEGVSNRLEQILLNLIVNAAEAMGGRGHLRVAVNTLAELPETSLVVRPRAAPDFVQITIADTGPGMAAEVRSRIFEPFFTTKTLGTVRGTGLGLSMVYTIVEEEGLGLILESEPGEGTTVRILVPVTSPA